MTQRFDPATTFALTDLGRVMETDADLLRKWFSDGENGGGLMLFPDAGDVPASGRRSHRLHWRTAVTLMLAAKLQEFGLRQRGGEAATIAGSVFEQGLKFEHIFPDEARPLILVQRGEEGSVYVVLIARTNVAGYVENIPEQPSFAAVGSILVDPASFGALLSQLAEEST